MITETITYIRSDEQGTETIEIIVDGDAVREVYTVDGTVCDDSTAIVQSPGSIEMYLHDRDVWLRADGYR